MTTLDDHLRKMDACSHLLPAPGGEVVRSCIRAIRVLVEQRDRLIENSLRERVILPDTFDAMFSHRVGASNADVLAALDAKGTP